MPRPVTMPIANDKRRRPERTEQGIRSTQSIVNLEGAGTVVETLQFSEVARRQSRACDTKKLPRSDVGEDKIGLREFRNFVIDLNITAKIFQMASEGI
jgi:hypothetical protein